LKASLCLFLLDVFCSYRKSDKIRFMNRCLKCRYYKQFLREMAEEDEKAMDEIDQIRKHGYHNLDRKLR